jgi:hypothetical protein
VEFTAATRVVSSATHTAVLPEKVIGTLDSAGALKAEDGTTTLKLLATDDADGTPVGWTWVVTEKFTNATGRAPFNLATPLASSPVDLPSAAPDTPAVIPGVTAVTRVNNKLPNASGFVTLVPSDIASTFPSSPHTHSTSDVTGLSAALSAKETAGAASAAVAAHEAAGDPHPQYNTTAEGDARYSPIAHSHPIAGVTGLQAALDSKEASGAASSALSAHLATSDPHPQYLTATETNGLYAPAAHSHNSADIFGTPLTAQFFSTGVAAVKTGTFPWYNDTGRPLVIKSVRASVGIAPSGSSLTITVAKNGATLSGVNASISANTRTAKQTVADVPVADGDYLTINITAIGSTTPGTDLAVQITLAGA